MKKINLIALLATIFISAFSYQDYIAFKLIFGKGADKNLQIKIADQEFKSAQQITDNPTLIFLPITLHTAITTNPLMVLDLN
jgi:hypothetical protein